MHPRSHGSPLGPIASRVGIAALLVLALFTLSQCRRVSDSVTGVEAGLFRVPIQNCIDKCQREGDKQLTAEGRLHTNRVAACGGNAACLAAEEARHAAALQAIEDQRRGCINNCHSQGGGN